MSLIFNNGTQLKTYDSKNKTKKCTDPLCGKIHPITNFYCDCYNKDPMRTKNVGDLILSGFLPHLPYSWIRSVTNLDTLLEILQEVYDAKQLYPNNIKETQKHIFQSLTKKGKIKVDENKRNDILYIMGSPGRRVYEYIGTLQILKLIDKDYQLTPFGTYLLKTKNTLVLFLSFYSLNIKNSYLPGKVYSNFNVRHFQKIFELLNVHKSLTLEDLTFILMAHEEMDFLSIHEKLFNQCSDKKLRKSLLESYFLGIKNKEMQRQKSAIFNLLTTASIINYRKKEKDFVLSLNATACMDTLNANKIIVEELLTKINQSENNLVEFHNNMEQLLNIFKNTFAKNIPEKVFIYKSGGKHEKKMIDDFKDKGINFRSYDKCYSHIVLPADVLSSLSGGTSHNPDQLCTLIGTNVLVDSKASNSIHNEVHKVLAYNVYAEKINSKAFIYLDNMLPVPTFEKINGLLKENSEKINRIALFTKEALDKLASNKLAKDHFEQIFKKTGFVLVCTKTEKLYTLFEKEINSYLYIIN